MTPKWVDVLDLMLDAYGRPDKQIIVKQEFTRMARAADAYNAVSKSLKEAQASMTAELPRLIARAKGKPK
jgi:hypothetical protein